MTLNPGKKQSDSEIILEVGSEGGTLTILGTMDDSGLWKFFVKKNESAMADFLSDEDRDGLSFNEVTGQFDRLESALEMLDKYPWWKLHLLHIHPDFLDEIKIAHKKRCDSTMGDTNFSTTDWGDFLS